MAAEESTLLHLDMDSFFASVEIRDEPSLRGLPVVVGGTGKRSVVAAASYPARAHGIRSAMPMEHARRLCRDLVIVPGRIDHYRAVSRQVMEVMSSVCARIEQISIDEAFADVRGARRQFGPPTEIGRILRARIRDELDLPASVGIAASRPVAKIASARAKPDGLLVIAPEDTASFLAPLPVGAISGVGPAAQASLERLGVRRIGQLADVPLSTLRRALGPQAPAVMALARGEDRTGLLHREHEVSVGTERTYEDDITDPEEVRRRLTIMCDEVAASLRARDLTARGVVLKLRSPDGATITRSAAFGLPTASGERLREHVIALWERAAADMPRVRLAGVRAEHLRPRSEQAAHDELRGRTSTWQELESAMDLARARFGSTSLSRGSTLPRDGHTPGSPSLSRASRLSQEGAPSSRGDDEPGASDPANRSES